MAASLCPWFRHPPWALILLGSCGPQPPPAAAPPAAPAEDRAETPTPPAAPSATPEPEPANVFSLLETPLGEVLVWLPGDTAPKPLLLIAHGAGGSPEWHCGYWAEVVADAASLLCLRGRPLGPAEDAFYFPHHHDLKERIALALAAFESAHASRWPSRTAVYVGYSQGATMGALLLPELAARLPTAILIEGGYEQWPVSSAQRFAKNGGQRIFFACGTRSCDRGAARSVRHLGKANVLADYQSDLNAGHTPAGAVGEIAQRGLAWLASGAAEPQPAEDD